MPVRDNRDSVTIKQEQLGGPTTLYSVAKMRGVYQDISALNNAGSFTPGKVRMNPVILQKFTVVSCEGRMEEYVVYGSYKYRLSGDVAAYLLSNYSPFTNAGFYASYDSSLGDYSRTKALAKVQEPAFDLGIMLAEMAETLAFGRHLLTSLGEFVAYWNKPQNFTRLQKGKRYVDMTSNAWLAWRYGATPLIIAFDDWISTLIGKKDLARNVLLRSSGQSETSTCYTSYLTANPGMFGLSGDVKVEVAKKATTHIYWMVTGPQLFADKFGMSLSDLPSIVWERIPLSFVWDWFFNIGAWLRAIKVTDQRQILACCTSQKTDVKMYLKSLTVKLGGVKVPLYGSSVDFQLEKLDRKVTATPSPSLVTRPGALSLQHKVDALTLLWQRLPKPRSLR